MTSFFVTAGGRCVLGGSGGRQVNPRVPVPVFGDLPYRPTVGPDDLLVLLSGGPGNADPAASTGGLASTTPAPETIGGLFPTVRGDVAAAGGTDRRCVYLRNVSPAAALYGVAVWLEQNTCGSVLGLGADVRNAVQVLTVTGTPVGGHFQIVYTGSSGAVTTGNIPWGSDADVCAGIEAGLADVGVDGVAVEFLSAGAYRVEFVRREAARAQFPLAVDWSGMIGDVSGWGVVVAEPGGPINVVAGASPSAALSFGPDPITVGDLRPGDEMALWLSRRTPPGTPPRDEDSAVLMFDGDLLLPEGGT